MIAYIYSRLSDRSFVVRRYNEHRILTPKIQSTIEDNVFSPVIPRNQYAHW